MIIPATNEAKITNPQNTPLITLLIEISSEKKVLKDFLKGFGNEKSGKGIKIFNVICIIIIQYE